MQARIVNSLACTPGAADLVPTSKGLELSETIQVCTNGPAINELSCCATSDTAKCCPQLTLHGTAASLFSGSQTAANFRGVCSERHRRKLWEGWAAFACVPQCKPMVVSQGKIGTEERPAGLGILPRTGKSLSPLEPLVHQESGALSRGHWIYEEGQLSTGSGSLQLNSLYSSKWNCQWSYCHYAVVPWGHWLANHSQILRGSSIDWWILLKAIIRHLQPIWDVRITGAEQLI